MIFHFNANGYLAGYFRYFYINYIPRCRFSIPFSYIVSSRFPGHVLPILFPYAADGDRYIKDLPVSSALHQRRSSCP